MNEDELRQAYLAASDEARDGFARWLLGEYGIATRPCACGCGKVVAGQASAKYATGSCRVRATRRKHAAAAAAAEPPPAGAVAPVAE